MEEVLIRIAVFIGLTFLLGMSWRSESARMARGQPSNAVEPFGRHKQAITTYRVARSRNPSNRVVQ